MLFLEIIEFIIYLYICICIYLYLKKILFLGETGVSTEKYFFSDYRTGY